MALEPIDSGDLETCPTAMGVKLKDIIPVIERALEQADGDFPYATFKFEDMKRELGSSTTNPYGFTACLNRLLSDYYKDKNLYAHTVAGNVMFDRVKPQYTRR
jgi:hypothetical protein